MRSRVGRTAEEQGRSWSKAMTCKVVALVNVRLPTGYVCNHHPTLIPLHPQQVSVCPFDLITGYTLFVDDEERAPDMVTRADMEGQLVVNLAGRCAEKLVMGESEVTSERQWAGRACGDRCEGAAACVLSYKQCAAPPARLRPRAPPLAHLKTLRQGVWCVDRLSHQHVTDLSFCLRVFPPPPPTFFPPLPPTPFPPPPPAPPLSPPQPWEPRTCAAPT